MTKLDSLTALADWAQALLTEIVKGIRNTFLYWSHRKDALEDLTKE